MRSSSLTTVLRQRLTAWALRRQGKDLLPLRLTARRVYILPTPAGWMFALLLGVMFIAGMNYGNGLALLFTFWLAGFALVGMVQTQRGLTATRLLDAGALPVHAGEVVKLRIAVSSSAAEDLTLQADGAGVAGATPPFRAGDDTRQAQLHLDLPAPRRGRWRAPVLLLSSTAPFGLFRTWTWLTLDVSTLVYPRAAGGRPAPETPGDNSGGLSLPHGQDELAWLRDFRDGDSPRQVAWKAYARGRPLLVREYHGEGAQRREFDFDALTGLDVEARLSQLTRWILDAHARGESWTLSLPGAPPLAGAGPEHLSQCLGRLALFGHREPGP
ncbi:MAG TPA: DUF58 domain-containing protein [Steroidobacteraceae bacterium]|nr:DUF58 domain-containing protein [Steroidobacteraceae bacterium]